MRATRVSGKAALRSSNGSSTNSRRLSRHAPLEGGTGVGSGPGNMARVFLEAALNGPWGRERQPLIPMAVADIVEQGIIAAKSGAGIIHVHAYDAASGRQKDDWQIYAR